MLYKAFILGHRWWLALAVLAGSKVILRSIGLHYKCNIYGLFLAICLRVIKDKKFPPSGSETLCTSDAVYSTSHFDKKYTMSGMMSYDAR